MQKRFLLLLLVTLLGAGLVLALRAEMAHRRSDDEAIRVAAAADLQFAFKEIGEQFQRETGHQVIFAFGSTGTLAKQIENGAPVDILAAADTQYIEDLSAKGMLISDTQQLYAVGRIVLANNKQSGLTLRDLTDLVRPEVKKVAIANPDHAPYGAAAKQALEAAGIWGQVSPKLVYGENVRQALQFIQTGNAEAGLIALSIASVPEIDYVVIDEKLHKPLEQGIAVVTGTKLERESREFIAFVTGPVGRSILKEYGFILPVEY